MHPEPADWRTLVVIPTYNEAENIGTVVAQTLSAVPTTHVLIVDDASPDGTGRLADELAEADDRVHVLHRITKNGLGKAYVEAFAWALEHNYDVVVEMDADGSHPASTLPEMIDTLRAGAEATPRVGVVIGSRWVQGGRVENWPKSREALSRGANLYARAALGIRTNDLTGGYRAYRADALAAMDLADVDSQGYCFQIDLTIRTVNAGFGVVEVPIVFKDREFGVSKMSGNIVVEAMLKVTAWGIGRRASQLRHLLGSRASVPGSSSL